MLIAYGIYLKDAIIVTTNGVTLTTLVILLWLYFNYREIKKCG